MRIATRSYSRNEERSVLWKFGWAILLSIFVLAVTGCTKSELELAIVSDANGYACRQCGTKFFTETKVFAAHCPKCKSAEIDEVMAFVCPDDKKVTLVPRGPAGVPCSQCGKLVKAMRLPQSTELESWGATLQSGEKVGG